MTSERDSLCECAPVPITEHWTCSFCASTMALAITPGSTHPEDGLWACPACFRAQCDHCEREATQHAWGWRHDNGHYRADALLCGPHMAGMRRRSWGGMSHSEPIDKFFARCGWRVPTWLGKHATRDGHVGYVELRDDWLGLFQAGCSCSGRFANGWESIRRAGDDLLRHLAAAREDVRV